MIHAKIEYLHASGYLKIAFGGSRKIMEMILPLDKQSVNQD
jgi:hypothetical protein